MKPLLISITAKIVDLDIHTNMALVDLEYNNTYKKFVTYGDDIIKLLRHVAVGDQIEIKSNKIVSCRYIGKKLNILYKVKSKDNVAYHLAAKRYPMFNQPPEATPWYEEGD